MMRVLLIGSKNAEILSRMLGYYGVDAEVVRRPPVFDSSYYDDFDASVFVGLFGRRYKLILLLRTIDNCFIYLVGSDVYQLMDSMFKGLFLKDQIIYVSEDLREILDIDGEVIPIPVDTKLFRPIPEIKRDRDLLYYNPGRPVYRPDWIKQYIQDHPEEEVTVLDGSTPYTEMPRVYNQHKRLIRMTTHDGVPKMPYEALLCGCKVYYNGEEVTEVPDAMLMEKSIPRLIKVLQ